MPHRHRIAGIVGSLREGSYNKRLMEAARKEAPERLDLEIITLTDIEPYNADVEAKSWPPQVAKLRDKVGEYGGVIVATPKYNYSIPGVLKNAIDWLSRPTGKGPITGKPAAVIGASTSMTGTARAQAHLRQVLFYNAMPLLASSEVLVSRAEDRFTDDGELSDPDSLKILRKFMDEFANFVDLHQRA